MTFGSTLAAKRPLRRGRARKRVASGLTLGPRVTRRRPPCRPAQRAAPRRPPRGAGADAGACPAVCANTGGPSAPRPNIIAAQITRRADQPLMTCKTYPPTLDPRPAYNAADLVHDA